MSDFWVNPVNIISPTAAEQLSPTAERQPYDLVDGVTSNDTTELQEGANTLFPLLDGTTAALDLSNQTVYGGPGFANTTLGPPADFTDLPANLNPNEFESWNSDYQLEYIAQHLPAGVTMPPVPTAANPDQSLEIGEATTFGTIHVIAASAVPVPTDADPNNMESINVYVLENLQSTDFASMSLADQTLIANTTYFQDTLANSFGLIPSSDQIAPINPVYNSSASGAGIGQILVPTSTNYPITSSYTLTSATSNVTVSTVSSAQKAMEDIIAGTEVQIVNDYVSANNAYVTANGSNPPPQLNSADAQVFISELDNLRTEVSNQAVFSQSNIQDEISAIYQRWTTVKDFGTVAPLTQVNDTSGNPVLLWNNVVSQDGGAGLANGYRTLMSSERQILDLQNQSLSVSSTGAIQDKSLDVPDLVAIFQLYANLTDEQINLASTQNISQTNDLLATYGVMQNIVNATIKAFNTTNTSQSLGLYGEAVNTPLTSLMSSQNLTTAQLQVLSMFEDNLGGKGPLNPIETLNSVPRPNNDSLNDPINSAGQATAAPVLNAYLQTSWNTFSTQLSDAVTLINQNSQILQNNITELQKEQDNHYDQANTALSNATTIITTIGQNFAN
jgi:hypothetical protein